MSRRLMLETDEGQMPVVWEKFVIENNLGAMECQEIGIALREKGIYRGGGGAEAEWTLFYLENK